MANDNLKKLHQVLIDTCAGYEKAVEEAQDASLKSLFADMAGKRRADHRAIHEALIQEGESPDDSGSFMSTLHRAAVKVRAATLGLDKDALSAFVSGEDHVLSAYDDALKEQLSRPALAEELKRQKTNVLEKIQEMKALELR